MKVKFTDGDWEWLEEKYGNLLHHIAYRIGGDKITNDHDDSYQELCIAILDSVEAFDGKKPLEFKKYKETTGFDKYLKTVLWNRKNNLGTKIKRRTPLRRQFTINEQIVTEKAHMPQESATPFGNEDLDADLITLIKEVGLDSKIIKPNGGLNINRLCRTTGRTKNQIQYAVERLKRGLADYNNGKSE